MNTAAHSITPNSATSASLQTSGGHQNHLHPRQSMMEAHMGIPVQGGTVASEPHPRNGGVLPGNGHHQSNHHPHHLLPQRVRSQMMRTNAYISYESQFLAHTAGRKQLQKLMATETPKSPPAAILNSSMVNSSPPQNILNAQGINQNQQPGNEEGFLKPVKSCVQLQNEINLEKPQQLSESAGLRPSYMDIIYPYITPELISSNSQGSHSHTFTYFLSPLPFAINQRRKRKRCSEPRESPSHSNQQSSPSISYSKSPSTPTPSSSQQTQSTTDKENRVVWLDALGQPQGEMVYKDGVTLFYCETDNTPERSTYLGEFYNGYPIPQSN